MLRMKDPLVQRISMIWDRKFAAMNRPVVFCGHMTDERERMRAYPQASQIHLQRARATMLRRYDTAAMEVNWEENAGD